MKQARICLFIFERQGRCSVVHALLPLDRAAWDEVAGSELRDVPRHRVDAGDGAALTVAVAAVRPFAVDPVDFCVHHGVYELLGEALEQLLHVDGVIAEPGEW